MSVSALERAASTSDRAGETALRIVTPVGMLGYGFPEADFARAIDGGVDAVVIDAGSTDPGPYLLGLDKTIVSLAALERDLDLILAGCVRGHVPLLVGSAGGAGTNAQVDATVEIVRAIARRREYRLKIAMIYAEVEPRLVRERLRDGRIVACASAPELTQADVDASTRIVAQMGAEPFLRVLQEHPDVDVVIAGRAYDPAPYAALAMQRGIDPGVYWHMGKIMECGGACAEPKGSVIVATTRRDSFDLTPMNPNERCTVLSVAAHTLYEKTRPDLLAGPGGVLDLTGSRYEQIDERTVRVGGSRFVPSTVYGVKLEGAAPVGYRTIFVGGIRDPILIAILEPALARVRARLDAMYPQMRSGEAQLHVHLYGKNAVMGLREPERAAVPHEVGLLGEVTAPTQDLANAIASDARISILHMPYPGQVATGGNFAIPLNPPENPIGPVCRFSIYHVMDVESPFELFPYRIVSA